MVAGVAERNGAETSRLALDWLEENQREKFFLFLHYNDPHDDYTPPEPFASQFADDPYAGAIAPSSSARARLSVVDYLSIQIHR